MKLNQKKGENRKVKKNNKIIKNNNFSIARGTTYGPNGNNIYNSYVAENSCNNSIYAW